MYLELDNNKYEVVIEKKNNKNTYIRVNDDLKIHVTTNRFTSLRQVEKLLIENKDSIRKMINKKIHRKEVNSKFTILGKELDVISLSGQKEPEIYGKEVLYKR